MQEKMVEMMSLLEEYSNIKTPVKVLLRKDSVTPTTKFVNSISIVHEGNKEKETSIAQTVEETPRSQSLGYYLKHDINEKTITNWIDGDGRNRSYKKDSEGEEVREDDYELWEVAHVVDSAVNAISLPGGPLNFLKKTFANLRKKLTISWKTKKIFKSQTCIDQLYLKRKPNTIVQITS